MIAACVLPDATRAGPVCARFTAHQKAADSTVTFAKRVSRAGSAPIPVRVRGRSTNQAGSALGAIATGGGLGSSSREPNDTSSVDNLIEHVVAEATPLPRRRKAPRLRIA